MALFGHDCGVPPFKNLIFLADIDPDLVWLKWKRRERKKRERKERERKKEEERERVVVSRQVVTVHLAKAGRKKRERSKKQKIKNCSCYPVRLDILLEWHPLLMLHHVL